MIKKLVPVALLSVVAFASCSRNSRIEVTPDPVDSTTYYTYSMNSIYTSLKLQPKTVTFDPSVGGRVIGNSGTVYTFPANAFQPSSGGSVTGTISLMLTEYLSKGDMIFSRVMPVSDGRALISGGELLVEAKQGNSKLYLRPGVTFTAEVPQKGIISTGMSFYYGQVVDASTNPINWLTGTGGAGTASTFGDTVTITSDSVGYIAAGKDFTSPSYQSFSITVNGVQFDDSDHVQAYAVYDDYRAVHPLTGRYHQKFTVNEVNSKPMHFVVYTVYRGDFYGGISSNSVTPLTGGNYTVNLTKQNPITFLQTVNGL